MSFALVPRRRQNWKRPPVLTLGLCMLLLIWTAFAASAQSAPAWQPNVAYSIGQLVTFNGVTYKCLQAHTSQVGWEPPNVPALWQPASGTPTPTPSPTPKPSPTPTPTPTPAPTPKPTPSPTPGGSGCAAAWSASQVYTGGMTASENGINYTAAFWTQNQEPARNNGPSGSGQPWMSNGPCAAPKPTPTPTPTPAPTPLPPGARLFAPYIDMSLTPDQQLLTIQQQSGIRVFTLAFIVGNGGCTPTWGGIGPITSDTLPNGTTISSLVNGVRQAGGDIIISFGGAAGSELAQGCADAASLQAAYQAVINKYNARRLDFDIEGGAVSDQASIDRRNQALKALKAANAGLIVQYTLPVLPTGLVSSGVNILNSVKSSGLNVDVVNILAMDYGGASVADPNAMAQNAINAGNATGSQIAAAGLSSKLGITVMVGHNDTQPEVFTLSDAQAVLSSALGNNAVTLLSIWSVARDNGGCPSQSFASPTCSGLAQNTYQFSSVFEGFH